MRAELFIVDHYGWLHKAKDPSKPALIKQMVEAWQQGKATEYRVWVWQRRNVTV